MHHSILSAPRMALVSATGAAALAAAPHALGQHADITPRVETGRIVTGAHFDSTGDEIPYAQVFGYDFQEDPADPFFAQDPGIHAEPGSGLPPGSQLRFSLLSGLTWWDGSGDVTFGPTPSGETLTLSFGASSVTLASPGGPQAGFSIGTVAADGSVHRHLNAFLNGSDGNSDPGDGNPPADGIYLISMDLSSSDPGIDASMPLFIVFNNGLDEQVHDEAIDYVQTHIVPEPSVSLLALTLAAASLRRRRAPGS